LAIIHVSAIINRIFGLLGNVIYQTYKGTDYTRISPDVWADPNTARQQQIRANLSSLSQSWDSLPPSYKELWNTFASVKGCHYFGHQAYISLNCNLLNASHADLSRIDHPPLRPGTPKHIRGFCVFPMTTTTTCISWAKPASSVLYVTSRYRLHRGFCSVNPSFGLCPTVGYRPSFRFIGTVRSDVQFMVHTHDYPSITRLYYKLNTIDKFGRKSPVSHVIPTRSIEGLKWTIRTSAADNDWFSVCWSPELSLFVAVATSGEGNRVMSSPNGINWTIRTSAANNDWRSVCWSPELSLFVAVATTGGNTKVMTSPNGVNWTIRTSAADNFWYSVCWSPELSLFVAVATTGEANRVMTSPNGVDWTIRTSAANNNWRSVCWSPDLTLFVAVANSGTNNRVMTSPNGIDWTIRTSAANNDWFSVCWSPGLSLFVAVAYSGEGNRVMTSPNGTSWTIRTSAADNDWKCVCWSPGLSLFMAVATLGEGNRSMTSPNGIDWTTLTSAADNNWRSVCWSPELSLFVAVANSGVGNRVMTAS